MYVELLSTALAAEQDPKTTNDSLLALVLDCRARMLGGRAEPDGSARNELAHEVAYDRALVHLSEARGIDVDPRRFDHPRAERARLETALTESGVDLTPAR